MTPDRIFSCLYCVLVALGRPFEDLDFDQLRRIHDTEHTT